MAIRGLLCHLLSAERPRMAERTYTFAGGVYAFLDNDYQLQLRQVQRDRHGRIWADAQIVTLDGGAILAIDHGDLTSGRWRSEFASQAAKRNSQDTLRWENLVMAALVALQSDPALSSVTTKPNLVPAPEFVRNVAPPGPTLVSDLIERGGLYGIVSKPKTGKTIVALNLALAVTGRRTWLGRNTSLGRVALFQLEDSERTIKRRLERMASFPPSEELLIHTGGPFRLTDENYEVTLAACKGCALVIVDPVIQASEVGDWNSQGEVRATYDRWRRLARDTDAAVVILAHHRKMAGDYGDQIAGSIQAQATLDGILELRRDPKMLKNQRRLSFVGRDWQDFEDEALELDPATLIFRSAGRMDVVAEEVARQRFKPQVEKLLAVLPTEPPGLTYDELAEKSGIDRRKLSEFVRLLGDDVAKSGTPRSKKDPLRFWRAGAPTSPREEQEETGNASTGQEEE